MISVRLLMLDPEVLDPPASTRGIWLSAKKCGRLFSQASPCPRNDYLIILCPLSVARHMREPDVVSKFAMSTSHPAAWIRSTKPSH